MHKFSFDPVKYANANEPQYQIARQFIAEYPFKGNETILDIGSGDGRTTSLLTEYTNGSVYGVDDSIEMVKFANEYAKKFGFRKLHFLRGKAESFDMKGMDLITSFFCIHLVKEVSGMFANIRKSISKSGKVMLLFPSGSNYFFDAMQPLCAMPSWSIYLSDSNKNRKPLFAQELYKIIEEHNFKVDLFEQKDIRYEFDSENIFRDWLGTTLYYLALIPETLQNEFLTVAISNYKQHMQQRFGIDENKNMFVFNLMKIILH